jgi:hypothetical protein
MATNSAKNHLKSHDELMDGFREHLKRIEAGQPPPKDPGTGVKLNRIDSLKAKLERTEGARDEIIKRYESKISALTSEISRLEKEVADDKKRQAGSGRKKGSAGKKGGAARSASKAKTKGRGKPPGRR